MTTAAPRDDRVYTPEELDECRQIAWATYRDGLRDLAGREYDEAEAVAWDRLQEQLTEVDGRRARIRVVG